MNQSELRAHRQKAKRVWVRILRHLARAGWSPKEMGEWTPLTWSRVYKYLPRVGILPRRRKHVFRLRAQGLAPEEIARRLEVPLLAVEQTLHADLYRSSRRKRADPPAHPQPSGGVEGQQGDYGEAGEGDPADR